jgi:hypothetical protein
MIESHGLAVIALAYVRRTAIYILAIVAADVADEV